MPSLTIILFSAFFLLVLLSFYYFKFKPLQKYNEEINAQNSEFQKKLNEVSIANEKQQQERVLFEQEKNKVQEKNRKIWQMSETVYKEKKAVDEQIEVLRVEKEHIESEKKKVDDKVKKLWNQSMAIHKEKEKINEIKIEIEIKHQEVIDSVNYAKRIQEAILPAKTNIKSYLPQSFILFKPRNIVSGDFYWFSKKNSRIIIASIDCTGHGVPGAFMSLIGNTLLNQIVNEKGITDPAEILNHLDKEVKSLLNQNEGGAESRDGMDAAICTLDEDFLQQPTINLMYAGANRPLFYIENNELKEIKADKFPIGGHDYYGHKKNFSTKTVPLSKNATAYIFTDGYADQFSKDDVKLKTSEFKKQLLAIQDKNMEEQREFLDIFIEDWKGGAEQTDDILVIGIRV